MYVNRLLFCAAFVCGYLPSYAEQRLGFSIAAARFRFQTDFASFYDQCLPTVSCDPSMFVERSLLTEVAGHSGSLPHCGLGFVFGICLGS